MNSHNRRLILFFLICLAPTLALANAGTPLMWGTAIHLAFGNAFIGIFEGLILSIVFSLRKIRTIFILILANYLSAWVGFFIINYIHQQSFVNLPYLWVFLLAMILLTYLITLVIEYPFVAWAFSGQTDLKRKAVKGSFIIQSSSYILIFYFYLFVVSTSIFTQNAVVSSSDFTTPKDVILYYISNQDGDVYSGPLGGGRWKKVYDLNSESENDRLLILNSATNKDAYDLVARITTQDHAKPKFVVVQSNLNRSKVPITWRKPSEHPIVLLKSCGTFSNSGKPLNLGSAKNSLWHFHVSFWEAIGIRGTNRKTGEKVSVSIDLPFISWNIRNTILLPEDKLLFQLGKNQICLYDPVKKEIAWVTNGRGPIPILK